MRQADLNPPLGHPGGPCYVVQRIRDEVSDPILRARLIQEVEEGDDLSNLEASKVYDLKVEPGIGVVRRLTIGPHAQYRMDLRGVNLSAIRFAFKMFLKQMNDWKSQGDWRYRKNIELLGRGEGITYTDPRMGLTVVFRAEGRDGFRLITTYWKGEPDPGRTRCITSTYSQPVENLSGAKTLVKPVTNNREPDSVLPSPPNTRSKPLGKPFYQVPPSSDEAPDGRNLHKDRVRTKGEPGGDEHPWVDNSRGYHQVRPDITASDIEAAMTGPQYPGSHRQRKQLGRARNYYRQRYRRLRGKIKQRAKRWYAKHRFDQRLKRDKERRRKYPERFQRKPGGGYHDPKDRAKDWREKRAEAVLEPVLFLYRPTGRWGWVLGADPETGELLLDLDGDRAIPFNIFFDSAVFESEDDVDRLFSYLDDIFYDPDVASVREIVAEDMGTVVIKVDDEITPGDQRYNRGDDPEATWPDKIPAEPMNNIRDPDNNPGSARVIPRNHGFVNKEAARISEIVDHCDVDLRRRSQSLTVRLMRVDSRNLMWLFNVAGSEGQTYKVKVKAVPKGNIRDVKKTDVFISCNCPYWRWQGPEYWAKKNGYLLGKPVGKASYPAEKDPDGSHRACKHALAVLERVSGFVLPMAKKKPKKLASLRFLADRINYVWGSPATNRVADRYLLRVAGRGG